MRPAPFDARPARGYDASMTANQQLPLTPDSYGVALAELAAQDRYLAAVIEQHGTPPFWQREPGFATLLLIILEQQVSLASARAAYCKLEDRVSTVTPESVLSLDDKTLRECGFSRQKSRYVRILANAIVNGDLDLPALEDASDQVALARLTALTGIGPWSAKVYLLMALRRPDIWPVGDIALATAWQESAVLQERPSQEQLEEIAAKWQPWRAVAARILWHGYLQRRGTRW